jgi:hypothetical protein
VVYFKVLHQHSCENTKEATTISQGAVVMNPKFELRTFRVEAWKSIANPCFKLSTMPLRRIGGVEV